MARKTTRIYHGVHQESGSRLYWDIRVTNATKPVALNGTVAHAMAGKGGVSIGCHLSNMAAANKSAFPHPVMYVSFTKTTALAITKITKGKPAHCVRYRHNYGRYVDLNDSDPSKRVIKEHPELFNRRFTLRPYKESQAHWREEYGRRETGRRSKMQMAKGELARMKKAGLVLQELGA